MLSTINSDLGLPKLPSNKDFETFRQKAHQELSGHREVVVSARISLPLATLTQAITESPAFPQYRSKNDTVEAAIELLAVVLLYQANNDTCSELGGEAE